MVDQEAHRSEEPRQTGLAPQKDLLNTEDVARYLGINPQTIWRWCREGRLPCLKIGKEWRIRRTGLEDFLEGSERSETLVGQLRTFLKVPDTVFCIVQNLDLMYKLDAAFFRVGEAHDGMLVKYLPAKSETSIDELRVQLERYGLEVTRLEDEGRLRFLTEVENASRGGRIEELRRHAVAAADDGRSLWLAFNWEEQVEPKVAVDQQEEIKKLVQDSLLVVKTSVLEHKLDDWPITELRRAQLVHPGMIWFLSDGRLTLSRVMQVHT